MSKATVATLSVTIVGLQQQVLELRSQVADLTKRLDLRQQHAEARTTTPSVAAPQRTATPVPAWQQERRAALAAAKAKAIAQGCVVRV